MKRVQILLPEELLERVDAAAGAGQRSEFIRDACEARLESGAAVAQTPVKRKVAGSNPASPAKPFVQPARFSGDDRSNAERFRARIAPVITGSFRTPRQISEEVGIPERIVEKMLNGMDVEWVRGAVRLR